MTPADELFNSGQIAAAILGSAVGDALGVPVEFSRREARRRDPVVDMRGQGTHNQPAGTWSDDTSLALCLIESLTEAGLDHRHQASRFVAWLRQGLWTPHGEVFDIGNATREAIFRLDAGVKPLEAGLAGEFHCGNGSLMRIAPLGLYLALADADERVEAAMQCSRLTHGHPRCQLACAMFTEVIAALVQERGIEQAVADGQAALLPLLDSRFPGEAGAFARLRSPSLADLDEREISSSGYVIHTLEASLWCALRANSFRDGVLAAVNLGDDTDTTGAVTGTLLGMRFGIEQIPLEWIGALAKISDVHGLVERFRAVCLRKWKESL
jgi:ADP-ribosyl-[dinitrogen reductase] hydrolase